MTAEEVKQEMIRVQKNIAPEVENPPAGWEEFKNRNFFVGYNQCLTEMIRFIERGEQLELAEKLDAAIANEPTLKTYNEIVDEVMIEKDGLGLRAICTIAAKRFAEQCCENFKSEIVDFIEYSMYGHRTPHDVEKLKPNIPK